MKISERNTKRLGRRLHPVSILYFLAHSGKELAGLLPLIPVGIVLIRRFFGREISGPMAISAVILVAAVSLISVSWLRWRSFTYRVEQGVLYIEYGLWVTKKIWISKQRVQSLDTSVNLYDRFFGLVRLQVETAGGTKPEAVLSSISAAEAERIRKELGLQGEFQLAKPADQAEAVHTPGMDVADKGAFPRGVWKLPLGRLFIAGTSTRNFGLMWLLTVGLGLKLWDEWLKPTEIWLRLQDWLGALGIPGAVLLLLTVSWLIAFAATFLLGYGFKLTAEGDRLIIEKGFLEKKQTTIAVRRVQAVQITENPLHKLFGLGVVRIVAAGNAEEGKKSIILFPLIRMAELPELLARFLPGFQLPACWNPLNSKARRSYIIVPFLVGLIASIGLLTAIPSAWSLFSLIIPAFALLERLLAFRRAAWATEEYQLSLQYGSFSRHRIFMLRNRVQWHRISQSPFQEGRRLATLKVAVASSKGGARYALCHAPEADTRKLSAWLSARTFPGQIDR
ncbi:PH domain-containing protein [Paenibacillus macerans]|uniref:PH domain-containing protein n=1 Tax=Paenibacillus macerans TaxID=44252 RepID=UPI002E1D19A6|nr:PH domain-containing protein [Paenibacillus macerans]